VICEKKETSLGLQISRAILQIKTLTKLRSPNHDKKLKTTKDNQKYFLSTKVGIKKAIKRQAGVQYFSSF